MNSCPSLRIGLRQTIAEDLLANTRRCGFVYSILAAIADPGFGTVLGYRLVAYVYERGFGRFLGRLLWRFHVMSSACQISVHAKIGPGLWLPHPVGICIGDGALLGRSVTVFQNVTIGRLPADDRYPIIGEGAVIFPNAIIIGNVSVGPRAIIGAGAVVVRDVPAGATVAGNPAKVIFCKDHPSTSAIK
jgi:serine O-acetyltransferase